MLSDLKHQLTGVGAALDESEAEPSDGQVSLSRDDLEQLAELIAERVYEHLRKMIPR